jgi:hypothetical protein
MQHQTQQAAPLPGAWMDSRWFTTPHFAAGDLAPDAVRGLSRWINVQPGRGRAGLGAV